MCVCVLCTQILLLILSQLSRTLMPLECWLMFPNVSLPCPVQSSSHFCHYVIHYPFTSEFFLWYKVGSSRLSVLSREICWLAFFSLQPIVLNEVMHSLLCVRLYASQRHIEICHITFLTLPDLSLLISLPSTLNRFCYSVMKILPSSPPSLPLSLSQFEWSMYPQTCKLILQSYNMSMEDSQDVLDSKLTFLDSLLQRLDHHRAQTASTVKGNSA